MHYLTQAEAIQLRITQLSTAKRLWIDTEVADWHTSQPRLSLIQVLVPTTDSDGDSVYIFDVLDQPALVTEFINRIIANPSIEKIFHNASYDLQFLGKQQAQNITCTLQVARKIGKDTLGVTNLKLKTLAVELCNFSDVGTEEQGSDWGRRSLTSKQLKYAAMDVIYLAAVHHRLLEITQQNSTHKMASNHLIQSSDGSKQFPLSATKVRIAFECPRLFYLNHAFNDRANFIVSDVIAGIGNPFHDLADQFVEMAVHESQFQQLFYATAEQLNAKEIAVQMQQVFYISTFLPYLQKIRQEQPDFVPALLKVWQGLQGLIQHFAEILVINRRHCSAEDVMRKTFIIGERKLRHQFSLPDGRAQQVIGKFDCLIYNFELHRLCMVEFKTYQSVDPAAQLAQVALYSYMLWTKKQVPVDSAIYCVLPNFKEYQYSWEQLEKTVHQRIPDKLQQMRQWLNWQQGEPDPPPPTAQPHLCQICPQYHKCQTFFLSEDDLTPKPKPKPVKRSPATPAPATSEVDQVANQLVQTLRAFGIDVEHQGVVLAPAFIRVKLKPNLGVKVGAILKSSDDLRVQMGLADPPLIAPQAGYVSVDLPRPDRQAAYFDRYLHPEPSSPTAPTRIAIGVNLDGQLIEADLSDPNTCHFLVGGTTGSGKSEFLRSLLLSLLIRHSPNQLQVALVDPKRVTFPEFEKMPWLYTPVVKESEQAIDLMERLVTEMNSRYQKFEVNLCNDLRSYNHQFIQQPDKLLPRIVCIFDEYADFMAEKETMQALELNIKRLGAMARAAGIHLIIATQRPEARVVTPIIRSNLPGRVALRTASEADSMIILGGKQTAAASLLGKGDLLYQVGANLLRLQSLFAPKIDLPKIV
ncbi:DNA translocase FtsK [Leptodesmis sichuanensis]|uniref:DNA translocase FtsK n=1 Tax=Leptodesmis sichuanensis TaxID=2906798 RepID=UPI001F340018|nr:DNA translocase FtsK [Leptodesmis sichuanensis]UIE39013.1 PD-(D/E)XK nuclease family protein [Leptodesmis sichuanensis A121]